MPLVLDLCLVTFLFAPPGQIPQCQKPMCHRQQGCAQIISEMRSKRVSRTVHALPVSTDDVSRYSPTARHDKEIASLPQS